MKKYKVAIAGYGIVGKKRHEFINKNPHLEVVAISDKNDAQLKDVKGNFKLFYDIEMMFKEEFEILFVCLINNVASEATIRGLKKGCHVFCEKPPGMSVEEIEEVISIEKQNPSLKLKYGFNHRYHDSVEKALSIVNSKNELQAQLDNLVSEINSISCPPIELASPSMKLEQLFCTYQYISPIRLEYDESIYTFSVNYDSIPSGMSVSKSPGIINIMGTPFTDNKDLFSFDLKFTSDNCEKIKRIVLARSPNSPSIGLVSGSKQQSIQSGSQIEAIELLYGGSAQGLTFSDLPEGLTYSIDGNKSTKIKPQ